MGVSEVMATYEESPPGVSDQAEAAEVEECVSRAGQACGGRLEVRAAED
jgi:hypothetical protein